jgi:hypothetical protein
LLSRQSESSKFHMPNGNCVSEISPWRHRFSTCISQYSGKVPTDNNKADHFARYPAASFTTLPHLSLSFHPRHIQVYYSQIRTTRPAHQRSSHTKGTYQIITCSISSAPTTPSDIVEIFFSCTTFALSSLPLSHSSQPPQLHPDLNTYPVADHLLRQTSLCPTQLPIWVKLPSTATCQNLTPSL